MAWLVLDLTDSAGQLGLVIFILLMVGLRMLEVKFQLKDHD